MNLELRKDVLEKALILEAMVNDILLLVLSIDKEERRALAFKSGSLSFRNKIDLLLDLEVISKDDNHLLLMLMEFRNQFMHNITCDSFQEACKILGPDKEKRLGGRDKDESFYINSYNDMFQKAKNILLKVVDNNTIIFNEKLNMVKKFLEFCQHFENKHTELFQLTEKFCINDNSDEIEELIGNDDKMALYKTYISLLKSRFKAEASKNFYTTRRCEYINFVKHIDFIAMRLAPISKVILNRNK